MFEKVISLTQPKEQFLRGVDEVSNPYYDSENSQTIYSFFLQNESIEEIHKLYVLIGNSVKDDMIENIEILETEENLRFKIQKTLNKKSCIGFNYLSILFTDEQKKLRFLTIRITLKGKFKDSDLSDVHNIFTLSTRSKLLPFYGDRFFVPCIQHKNEVKLTKKSWKEINTSGGVILNYRIEVSNFTEDIIPKLKLDEELYVCKDSIRVDKIEINDSDVKLIVKDGIYNFKKNILNLARRDRVTIYFRVFMERLNTPGIYNFPSISKLHFGVNNIERCSNLQLKVNEMRVDSTCIANEKSNTQFSLNIRNGSTSPDADILIKNTLIIPKGIKIKLSDMHQMEMFNMGEKIESLPEYLTDTILELTFRRKVMNNSEIEIPIDFSVIQIEGERTSDYIKNIVEDVKVLNSDDSENIIHYKNKKSYLKVLEAN